jgi:hypothetical protein
MSLLTTASVWVDTPKKRTPTIRKTIKKIHTNNNNEYLPFTTTSFTEKYQNENNEDDEDEQHHHQPQYMKKQQDMKKQQETQDIKNNKVNILLDKMNNINSDNDGSGLYNYIPPPPSNKLTTTINEFYNIKNKDTFEDPSTTTVQENSPMQKFISKKETAFTYPSNIDLANSTNYKQAYDTTTTPNSYYANMGISMRGGGGGGGGGGTEFENKIMDKIQYLTHLMEEMQNEKTANITEEFILYTMLGVFVIYTIDLFNKG